jgi:hypothetical protein
MHKVDVSAPDRVIIVEIYQVRAVSASSGILQWDVAF